MNYVMQFRSLPFSTSFRQFFICILILQTFGSGKSDTVKKPADTTNDEKAVFEINFGKNKKYEIDDCIPLAFGDFNADKVIDIFCRNTQGIYIRYSSCFFIDYL